MKQYDIAVIGAGSGGLVAALTAQRRGARVVLIERYKIGGECTHFGCVPSKTLIASARLFRSFKKSAQHGLPQVELSTALDFGQVMEHVNQVVQGIYANEQPAHFEGLGIDVYIDPAGASFLNNNEIQIGGEIIWADYTVISTGSSPRMAPHEGSEILDVLTNENFWDLRDLPRSIVFLGGGVISAELGQSLARFGSAVTIIDRNPRILKAADEAVSALAAEILQQEGVQILTNAEVIMCRQIASGKINLSIVQNGQQKGMTAEHIFVALGRTPNTSGLQLEKANVAYSDKGIEVNNFLQTTTPNIYACGDVASPAKFTHMASYQAEICVENILNDNHVENDLSIVPWAIFMEPEIGHVGLTEAEARRKFGEVIVSQVNTSSIDRFITEGETVGFLKLVMDKNDVILGADAMGIHAGEWIQFLTLAIKQKLTLQALAETIFIYPTFSEIVKKAATRYLRAKQSS
jgi:pyruvate/2-oxoglutarate dehydrogenase complex dihydrolipoamide dehydrogenase (E3) component